MEEIQSTVNTDTLKELIENCEIENIKEVKKSGNKK